MPDAPLAPPSLDPVPAAPRSAQAPALDAKSALAWAHTARFFTTAAELKHLPQSEVPEVAFVGRSNAGKSTAINTLAQTRRLAFASKTPGRTQHINLFALGPRDAPDAHWADLPGYGYAAVPKSAKVRWQRVMAHYLDVRRNLAGVVMMVDSRLGFTEIDRNLLDYVAPRVRTGEVKLLVLLTKADKLTRAEGTRALQAAQIVLGEIATDESDLGMTLFSALNKTGLEDVALTLRQWVLDTPRIAMPDVALEAPPGEPSEIEAGAGSSLESDSTEAG
jgi:GTP-binding protein